MTTLLVSIITLDHQKAMSYMAKSLYGWRNHIRSYEHKQRRLALGRRIRNSILQLGIKGAVWPNKPHGGCLYVYSFKAFKHGDGRSTSGYKVGQTGNNLYTRIYGYCTDYQLEFTNLLAVLEYNSCCYVTREKMIKDILWPFPFHEGCMLEQYANCDSTTRLIQEFIAREIRDSHCINFFAIDEWKQMVNSINHGSDINLDLNQIDPMRNVR